MRIYLEDGGNFFQATEIKRVTGGVFFFFFLFQWWGFPPGPRAWEVRALLLKHIP